MNRTVLISLILIAVVAAGALAALAVHKNATIVVEDQVYPVVFWGFKVANALAASGILVYEGDLITPKLEEPSRENETVVIVPAFWVKVAADGESHTMWTAERRPNRILSLASVQLNPGDVLWSNGILIDPSKPLPYAPTHSLQVRRSTLISLDSDGEVQTIRSTAPTLGDALSEAGILIYAADHLIPAPDTRLTGQDIQAIIERSRDVVIQTRDKVIRTRVLGASVGEALNAAGMPLQGLNYSLPAEDKPIPSDGHIRVVQVQEEITLEQDPLPFGIQYQPLPQVDLDTQQVVQVGEYGLHARRVRVVYEDDQEISRTVEDEWIAKQPKPRIIGYGTKITIQTVNTPDGPIQYWRAVDAYATSYSPCRIGLPDQCSNRTASGKELQKGVIGVIRSWYNNMRGLAVYITGYGYATIEDIGAGFSDRDWVDLGYSDDDWVSWAGYVTVYFLSPAPANIMYLLE